MQGCIQEAVRGYIVAQNKRCRADEYKDESSETPDRKYLELIKMVVTFSMQMSRSGDVYISALLFSPDHSQNSTSRFRRSSLSKRPSLIYSAILILKLQLMAINRGMLNTSRRHGREVGACLRIQTSLHASQLFLNALPRFQHTDCETNAKRPQNYTYCAVLLDSDLNRIAINTGTYIPLPYPRPTICDSIQQRICGVLSWIRTPG